MTRPYSIKPDMSQLERSRESALMQERWSLIQGGIDRKCVTLVSMSMVLCMGS